MHRIVVVGSSLAAVHTIEGLRHNGYEDEIVLVGGEPGLPYDRPPLSKEALRDGLDRDAILLKPAAWYADSAVELQLGEKAVALDVADRRVFLESGRAVDYDGLVIATGCVPRAFPGGEDAPVHVLRTADDCFALRQRIVAGHHMVVIGAGFIGLEVASIARAAGMDVTVVEAASAPLSRVLGDHSGAWFRDFHAARGIDLRCDRKLVQIHDSALGGHRIELSDGTELRADVIVAGVGVSPATDWLTGSGLAVSDGVLCDASLATDAPGVVAVGDVARWDHHLFGETIRIEQWLNAVEQGAHAARTLLGAREEFKTLPYFWSDQFDAKIRFVGYAGGADQIAVTPLSDNSLVTLFGRSGRLRGALCVNSPRMLARFRKGILDGLQWDDAVRFL